MDTVRCSNSIILEKIRLTLNFLRKANIFSETGNNENPLLASFRELQNVIRYSTNGSLSPTLIMGPFLSLLKVQNMTGPFVLIALDSIQAFICCDVLTTTGDFDKCSESLIEIVNVIVFCRYVQTDNNGDELVQLRIMQTLHKLVICTTNKSITDDTIWRILQFAFASLVRNGFNKRLLLHYHEAESVVVDTIKLLLWRSSLGGVQDQEDFTCLTCVIRYLLQVVDAYSAKAAENHHEGSLSGAAGSQKLISGMVAPLGDFVTSSETQHVMFSLTTLHYLLSMGNCASPNSIETITVRSSPLRKLLTDDLGLCILQLLQSRAQGTSAQLMQVCLSIFMALRSAVGPCLRILVECFMKQVYIRALVQISGMIAVTDRQQQQRQAAVDTPLAVMVAPSGESFSVDELEMILESLCDLLADATFVPSLFASFDCDPTRPDIAQPLLRTICTCSSFVLRSGAEYLGQFKEIGILVVQLYKHILNGFGVRFHAAEAANEVHPALPQSSLERADLATLFRCGRVSKLIMREAAARFIRKPEAGLRYLQSKGALSTPLTAAEVANFLRLSPDLPKEVVGSYLGELGKDCAVYEGDGKDFHSEVLLKYVNSFEFSGQGILDCMRIFLSAFRLPGEAQQIDRILVAFSEYCHSNSAEGRSGLLQNAEVTYLLSFSIIMLNTDRHNPNIRDDRRMTVDQFVRNNTNYGKDVHQTLALPRPFLVGIYDSISELPIRTQSHELVASVALEVWKDMQLQASVDPRKSVLLTFSHSSSFFDRLLEVYGSSLQSSEAESSSVSTQVGNLSHLYGLVGADCVAAPDANIWACLLGRLFTRDALFFGDPLLLSKEILGAEWALDADIVETVGASLLQVGLSVHCNNFQFVVANHRDRAEAIHGSSSGKAMSPAGEPGGDGGEEVSIRERTGKFLFLSNEFLVESLRIFRVYRLEHLLDLSVVLLGGFCGLLSIALTERAVDLLVSQAITGSASVEAVNETLKEIGDGMLKLSARTADSLVPRMLSFPSMRASLSLLLQVVHINQTQLTLWPLVLHFLGLLRDAALLPPQMVRCGESDVLPAQGRLEFEARLANLDRVIIKAESPVVVRAPAHAKSSSSLLSLQGLGEALFGGGTERAGVDGDEVLSIHDQEERVVQTYLRDPVKRRNLPSARWDVGYEEVGADPAVQLPYSTDSEIFRRAESSLLRKSLSQDDFRLLMWSNSIHHLVADTRFMSEDALRNFFVSLVNCTEVGGNDPRLGEDTVASSVDIASVHADDNVTARNNVVTFFGAVTEIVCAGDSVSKASVAWYEMLLVEVALRNRDRFGSLWPILSQHYARTLSEKQTHLSYVIERRVVGMLKIATRMISRDIFSGEILSLLGRLLTEPQDSSQSLQRDDLDIPSAKASETALVTRFSDQVASGMWLLLTLNVESLPQLPLEQWQIIFGIIACTATGDSFSALKSFESMAWLLHEPRLVAKVPVFCIMGVRPLLENARAPVEVSVGAVQLLLHLHSRLKVLIKEDSTDGAREEEDEEHAEGDASLLWESCWLPILKTLADGLGDCRGAVSDAAVDALVSAVMDRHASAVPAGVLVKVLGDVVMPAVEQLGQRVLSQECPHSGPSPQLSHPPFVQRNWMQVEMRQSAVQERELVDTDSESNTTTAARNDSSGAAPETDPEISTDCLAPSCKELVAFKKCVEGLCTVFNRHIKKLSGFPAFDKLWLQLLDLLAGFLRADYGSVAISRFAAQKLREVLQVLTVESVFERREGLRTVTEKLLADLGDTLQFE